MAATFTCQRPDLPGGSSNHRPLSPTISSPPLSPAPEHTTATSYLMTKVPSLSIVSPGVNDSKEVYATTIEVTDITVGAGSPPIVSIPVVEDQLSHGMESTTTPSSSSKPNSRRTSKRKRTTSPPSPSTAKTPDQLHTSRRSSPHSQHSSIHSHRRSATTASITPISDRTARREDLIALHRESCRLFQDDGLSTSKPSQRASASASASASRPPSSSTSRTPPRPLRSVSNASSPPTLRTPLSISTYQDQSNQNQSPRGPVRAATFSAYEPACISPVQPTVTVIDWTSPSTRRREYEKIDRASSGVRGFWRRVAPRWCQFGDHRTPFFEEGKDGKGNYEGSVRRFRMDLPEECESKRTGTTTFQKNFKLTRKMVIHRMGGRVKTA
ncbi:hypothetical protein CBS76997_7109 [Aspergillus niger]|uniref:uncharacterized protein n=1 Tax=Aspergillus lacticoffeatus (strain CBS 101883) TaxID=1450533 RepID=UPI000D7F2735|nr:uncharacterized protein BO96DRAFT_423435 [Aspergillus niger CBS 101883]KAI2837341.1 hypothetical protein CBS11350_8833 [Aspergillus niger]KAI2857150.1 hypothetical protein CBS12448_6607 [Aspergillus niger]KAI2886449.1 hypothetical protein CBS13152_7091 [Aspergillus niger]KAI2888127.1 hypothetical protein CBS11852_7326 [Aspergillus niger]KAI2935072.1 hypothetical protein CBS147320_806 [Aspergillus niger]